MHLVLRTPPCFPGRKPGFTAAEGTGFAGVAAVAKSDWWINS
jgi:hypothetical protein